MDVSASRRLIYRLHDRAQCYGGRNMRLPNTILRTALFGAGALLATLTASAQISDKIRGAPSEANHFIETPRGWQHPKTPWGEPDIQAKLNMMQAAGVPLERC